MQCGGHILAGTSSTLGTQKLTLTIPSEIESQLTSPARLLGRLGRPVGLATPCASSARSTHNIFAGPGASVAWETSLSKSSTFKSCQFNILSAGSRRERETRARALLLFCAAPRRAHICRARVCLAREGVGVGTSDGVCALSQNATTDTAATPATHTCGTPDLYTDDETGKNRVPMLSSRPSGMEASG